MKKKILALSLIVCLIIPMFFGLTACSKPEPEITSISINIPTKNYTTEDTKFNVSGAVLTCNWSDDSTTTVSVTQSMLSQCEEYILQGDYFFSVSNSRNEFSTGTGGGTIYDCVFTEEFQSGRTTVTSSLGGSWYEDRDISWSCITKADRNTTFHIYHGFSGGIKYPMFQSSFSGGSIGRDASIQITQNGEIVDNQTILIDQWNSRIKLVVEVNITEI